MKINIALSNRILITLIVISTLILPCVGGCGNTEIQHDPGYKIVVELESDSELIEDSIQQLKFSEINQIGNLDQWNSVDVKISGKNATWIFYTNGPVMVSSAFGFFQILTPGDSIFIKSHQNDLTFSGRGAEKPAVWYQIIEEGKKLVKPTKNSVIINSLVDYFKWNEYVDRILALQISTLDAQKDKIQKDEYEYLKSIIVETAEHDRVNAFMALMSYSSKDSNSNLKGTELSAIWDSTQYKPWSKWLRSLPTYHGPIHTHYTFNKGEVYRRFNFDLTNDSLKSKVTRTYLYYATAKDKYMGLTRERLMTFILDEQTIMEMGSKHHMTQLMLKDYYSLPGFPEYKAWVKSLEKGKNK